MSKSVNRVVLLGRVGREPELKYTAGGIAYCRFSIATDESWKKDGQQQERTEWHNIVAWDKLADICGKHVQKGRQLYVEGQIQSRQWEDNDGNKRTSYEIRARDVVLLGGGEQREQASAASAAPATDDDIPF